jgi:hypothetical protein
VNEARIMARTLAGQGDSEADEVEDLADESEDIEV